MINLKTEGKSDFKIQRRWSAPKPIKVIVRKIFSKVIAPYLLDQADMESNRVHAVAAPVVATAIALHKAISLNLGSAINFCALFNWVRPNKPPTQKLIAIT